MRNSSVSGKLQDASYFSFYALIVVTPLVFSLYLESTFDLAKKSSLLVIGGIFIILTIIYLLLKPNNNSNEKGIFFIDKQFDPYIFLFLISAGISVIFSIKPYMSYNGQYSRHLGFISYLYVFLVYWFSSQLLKDKNKTAVVTGLMEFSAVTAAVYALLQNFGLDPYGTPVGGGIRSVSTMGNSIFAGGFMAIVLPFSFIRIFKAGKPFLGIILSAVILGGILVTKSRAAYASVMVIITVILLLYPLLYRKTDRQRYIRLLKLNLFLIVFLVFAVVVLILLIPSNSYVNRFMNIAQLTNSARWLLWRDSFGIFAMYPVTGTGIAAFSNVFENVISHQLRTMEVRYYYDNAHNVFLNTLCTMGILGAFTYTLMFFQSVKSAFKAYFNESIDNNSRIFFLAALVSLIGYTVYTLADFENTPILLYVFVIFAMLKTSYSRHFASELKPGRSFKIVKVFISAGIIAYCLYNVYFSFNELKADYYYREGIRSHLRNDFPGTVNNLNKAVTANYGCSEYKYTLADYVQLYCLENKSLKDDARKNLLTQAMRELERAKPNFFSEVQYKALMCVINFQLGNITEAEKMKKEVNDVDSLLINFRINLARYYLSVNDIQKMKEELAIPGMHDPYNTEAISVYVKYYLSVNDRQSAVNICDFYLSKDPDNRYMRELKEYIKSSAK